MSMNDNSFSERLYKHCRALPELILHQLSQDGAVVVREGKDSISQEDPVCTHHLIEWTLSCNGDPLKGIRDKALSWMIKNNNLPHDPFTLDSFLSSGVRHPELLDIVAKIAKSQLPNGLLPFYTGYLYGGDHFSTLWGIKILSYTSPQHDGVIQKAFSACLDSIDYYAEHPSHLGFLFWLLNRAYGCLDITQQAESIKDNLISAQDNTGLWDDDPMATAFVCYDLVDCHNPDEVALKVARKGLTTLFDLHTDAESIPSAITNYREKAVDSAFLQMVLRSIIAGNKMLQQSGEADPGLDLSSHLVGTASTLVRVVDHLVDRTKTLEVELEKLRRIPEKYRSGINDFLKDSSYENNVFIMMTFAFHDSNHGNKYKEILEHIRSTLARRGLRGFIVTDKRYDETVYGNLQIYINSCSAGIAVFDNLIPEKQHNPNVAMEAGYMMAQGKPVAILKDNSLPKLPSDWAGHYYYGFNSHSPATLVEGLEKWLQDSDLGHME